MKRLLKRITGFILLITIMTSAIGPTVFAAQKNDVKTNFKYEVGNIEDLDSAPLARSTKPIEIIYTYTQNGENFRVYIVAQLSRQKSKIFIMNWYGG